MTIETIDTLVIGAGQAGIAASEHLSRLGIAHLVLERDRIAERWRSGRWDSLVTNGPAWHDRFPGRAFSDANQDAFVAKDQVADYLEAYARQIHAPIRAGVDVTKAIRNQGRPGFTVSTSAGEFEAQHLIVATGPFQLPVIPAMAPDDDRLTKIHSAAYKNPQQLPEGGVLVVGAGSSGVQIAEELLDAGRDVYLSVGPHDRPPRRYRNRDFCWWLGVLGLWDAETATPGKEHVTIAVSGAGGGHTIDFRELAARGMRLVGRTHAFEGGVASFQPDLSDSIRAGDQTLLSLLDAADAYVERNGLDLPEEPAARHMLADPECMTHPLRDLDLIKAGVRTIIWATGYTVDYRWLHVNAFDETGAPKHQRGVSAERGVYFLGLPWLSRRGSSFIWGVWHDAKHVAGHIATQQTYRAYRGDEHHEIPAMATHSRIRRFNTRDTYPNQSLDNDLSQAVRAGNTVYVRGQVGTDFDGTLVGLGDPAAQTEQAMKNVKVLLEEAGSDLSHIVKTTTYLVDSRYREPVYGVVGRWLKGVYPVSTGLVVSALAQPQWLMEIDVTAVIPDDWHAGATQAGARA